MNFLAEDTKLYSGIFWIKDVNSIGREEMQK